MDSYQYPSLRTCLQDRIDRIKKLITTDLPQLMQLPPQIDGRNKAFNSLIGFLNDALLHCQKKLDELGEKANAAAEQKDIDNLPDVFTFPAAFMSLDKKLAFYINNQYLTSQGTNPAHLYEKAIELFPKNFSKQAHPYFDKLLQTAFEPADSKQQSMLLNYQVKLIDTVRKLESSNFMPARLEFFESYKRYLKR